MDGTSSRSYLIFNACEGKGKDAPASKQHTLRANWGYGGKAPQILDVALNEGEWSA